MKNLLKKCGVSLESIRSSRLVIQLKFNVIGARSMTRLRCIISEIRKLFKPKLPKDTFTSIRITPYELMTGSNKDNYKSLIFMDLYVVDPIDYTDTKYYLNELNRYIREVFPLISSISQNFYEGIIDHSAETIFFQDPEADTIVSNFLLEVAERDEELYCRTKENLLLLRMKGL